MKQYLNRNDHKELKVPMVVLINGGSASASEIVSGSLKLLDRALLIGEKSFGKGVVQTASSIRQGEDPVTLKLTIAQYLLSNGFSVHDKDGVEPHFTLAKLIPRVFRLSQFLQNPVTYCCCLMGQIKNWILHWTC